MKKLLALLTLVLALVSPSALAADADTETSLWPAYDPVTGMWGYIDAQGAWGIEARYLHAFEFVNGYAEVRMSDDYTACGIIDKTGAYIFQPDYYINRGTIGFDGRTENDVYTIDRDGLSGWFDTESGYISGLCWKYVESYDDSPYVLAGLGRELTTFVDRATGKRLLPLMDMSSYGFYEDVAVVWLGDEDRSVIVDLKGNVIELPEGLGACDTCFSDGMLLVENAEGLYGYVNTAGQLVIEPQYEHGEAFQGGYTVVTKDGGNLLIDKENRVIATGWLYVCGPWADGGIAVEGDNCWAVLNQDGTVRFRVAVEPYEYAKGVITYPPLVEGGPWWVGYWYGGVGIDFGLMTADGVWLVDADDVDHSFTLDNESFSDDPMGWQAAWYDGKWGYIDGAGNTMLPFIYEEASHFSGALAYVCLDASTEGYINRSGEIVYQWPSARGTW